MFERPGKALQSIAKIIFWILFITYLIIGIIVWVEEKTLISFLTGLLVVIFGGVLAYLSCISTYCFGRLVENSENANDIKNEVKNLSTNLEFIMRMHYEKSNSERKEDSQKSEVNSASSDIAAINEEAVVLFNRSNALSSVAECESIKTMLEKLISTYGNENIPSELLNDLRHAVSLEQKYGNMPEYAIVKINDYFNSLDNNQNGTI